MSDDDLDLAEDLRVAIGDFVRHVRVLETMPPGQAGALGHLVRQGPHSIADLARLERVKHQSMARTVGLLASQDLVTLAPAEHDRRQVVVTVTEAGVARLAEQRRVRAERIAAAVTTLGDEERDLVARLPALLRKLQVASVNASRTATPSSIPAGATSRRALPGSPS